MWDVILLLCRLHTNFFIMLTSVISVEDLGLVTRYCLNLRIAVLKFLQAV